MLGYISSEELRRQIWNKFDAEKQKAKIKELLNNKKTSKAIALIDITDNQINKEMLDEVIEGNDPNVDKENILVSIWGDLPEEIQIEYFDRVMGLYEDELDDRSAVIWRESSEEVQRRNFKKYLKTIYYENEQIIEMITDAKLPRTEVIDYILQEYHGAQLEEIVAGYLLDVPVLEKLNGKISPDVSIQLVIKNVAELSNKKLKKLCQNFNITTIRMQDDNLNMHQTEPYDLEKYIRCRDIIDNELLKGIDLLQNSNDPNREKRIFGQVVRRIADRMSYDYVTSQKEDNETATLEEKIICRNLEGGLFNKTCVCAGYAEILRNVLACCDIEAIYISGKNTDPEGYGHSWVQVKLDGVWYNADLTWDRDNIVAGELPLDLLKSDEDFKEHDKYDTSECKKEKCSVTVPDEELLKYLYGDRQIPEVMFNAIKNVTGHEVCFAYETIARTRQQGTIQEPTEEKEQQE